MRCRARTSVERSRSVAPASTEGPELPSVRLWGCSAARLRQADPEPNERNCRLLPVLPSVRKVRQMTRLRFAELQSTGPFTVWAFAAVRPASARPATTVTSSRVGENVLVLPWDIGG